ncbi:MAG: patatin-like phospholipase family protein [Bacteroidetes bacterium]|nr:patatin-like phospholipase family protein [Bacteroidota bacterium]
MDSLRGYSFLLNKSNKNNYYTIRNEYVGTLGFILRTAKNFMRNGKKIGLSLSGGGYRAAAYHLGTLKKLNEMKILEDIDIISSVSGGSITSAVYGLNGDNFPYFEKALIKGVMSSVIKGIIFSPRFLLVAFFIFLFIGLMIAFLFTNYAWISFILLVTIIFTLIKFQFFLLPISRLNEDLYNKFFFKGKVLNDFNNNSLIAINATNLETGRLFTFSKNKMSDSSYAYPRDKGEPITFKNKQFPVSKAVAASTCVPFAFTPISIDKIFYTNENDFDRVNPKLIDGGVYDNQGIHKITQEGSSYECDIIITSDAGNIMPYQSRFQNTIQLLIRTSEIFMNRIKNFQMIKNVYENSRSNKKEIAYFSLGWDLQNCIPGFISNLKNGAIIDSVISAHNISKEEINNSEWDSITEKLKNNIGYDNIIAQSPSKEELSIARSIKTSLKTLKENEISALIKHSYCITELQIKLYCPTIIE